MSNAKILTYTFGVIILFFIYSSFFTVDQTKQAIVLQFGEPKRLVNKPGLIFKIPFIQEVTYFEKRVLSLVSSDSEEVILSDQKRLEVDTYSRFKIIDPDSKQDVGDEIVGHVFVVIAIVLIYRLSYTIYA